MTLPYVLTGPAKKTRIQDEETNICTAYHEAGHTLVAYHTSDATALHKVTIVPRGTSLGHVSACWDSLLLAIFLIPFSTGTVLIRCL